MPLNAGQRHEPMSFQFARPRNIPAAFRSRGFVCVGTLKLRLAAAHLCVGLLGGSYDIDIAFIVGNRAFDRV